MIFWERQEQAKSSADPSLCRVGLESDEEGEDQAMQEEERESPVAEPSNERKLKRKKLGKANTELTSPASTNGNMRDLFGDSDDDVGAPAAASGGPHKADDPPANTRQRNAQLFGDSDDE